MAEDIEQRGAVDSFRLSKRVGSKVLWSEEHTDEMASMSGGAEYVDLVRPEGPDSDAIIGPLWPEWSISDLRAIWREADVTISEFEVSTVTARDEGLAEVTAQSTRFAQLAPQAMSVVLGATWALQLTLVGVVERVKTERGLAYLCGAPFDEAAQRVAAHAECLQAAARWADVLEKVNSVIGPSRQ